MNSGSVLHRLLPCELPGRREISVELLLRQDGPDKFDRDRVFGKIASWKARSVMALVPTSSLCKAGTGSLRACRHIDTRDRNRR